MKIGKMTFTLDKNNIARIMPLVFIGAVTLLLAGIVIYWCFLKLNRNIKKTQQPNELIAQIDKLISSINQKNKENPDSTREKSDSTTIALNGIVLFSTERLAVLNNQVASIGDEINGFRVRHISDRYVVLENKEGKKKILSIYGKE